MKMKRTYFTRLAALALTLILALSLTACGGKDTNTDGDNSGDTKVAVKIGVPNDTTNEARALLLLQENGIIKLADGAGITATKNDIVDNPYNVEIVEAEAAQLPNMLPDLDYAVINSNYAINAGLNPVNDSLFIEGSASAYANILAVKEGNENEPKILALKAALESKQVADYIAEKYAGSVVSVVENPTDGYDASVDYEALKGQTITIAASPTPHAEILEVAKTILAAKGITLDINEGEFVSLTGASGSGKSTLMNILGCLDRPTSGHYYIAGEDVAKFNAAERATLRNKRIGFVFQNFNLLSRTTALENVMMPAVYAHPALSMKAMRERSVELLNLVGLSDRMDHTPAQLSGGQQQRVAIARSLINNPSILLADEPTGNLDSTTSKEVLHMFKDLNRQQGITVILVTHDPKIAAFTDRAINMADGLICEGISDMLSKDDV